MTPLWMCVNIAGSFHYTSAWSNANSFVNYWGLKSKYSNHSSFANSLSAGNFITEDIRWAKSGYRDYEVAQHSRNYIAWASGSTCGWDTLKNTYPNVVYGKIQSSM